MQPSRDSRRQSRPEANKKARIAGRFAAINYEPTEAEIKAACALIQQEWTVYEEMRRRGCRNIPDLLRGVRNTEVDRYRFSGEVVVSE
jgi:hypothetical protein